ncbi:hypothetical protein HMN09_01392000 [Mycena chlorophos]|uniref:F-box domain-containing protein n=1 Tax=Mycena chlorophos TaxID=658473 RepID=A0A8H6RWV9_MYCCL|nr:hypothetical protein HMN09_01392000 [Mycena chlorophos]
MSTIEAPLLLGRVCKTWRSLVYSTPKLWASLHLVEPGLIPFVQPNRYAPVAAHAAPLAVTDATKQAWAKRLRAAQIWLGRSAGCALSISLRICTYDAMSALLPLLTFFADRWGSIEFLLHYPYVESPFLEQFGLEDFPALRSVAIVMLGPEGNPLDKTFRPWRGILSAKGLQSLRMKPSTGSESFALSDLPLSWKHLVDLRLDEPLELPLKDVVDLLRRCPVLRSLRAHLLQAELAAVKETALGGNQIDHGALEDFCLHGYERTPLPLMSLPRLKSLDVKGLLNIADSRRDTDALIACVQSSTVLTSIAIHTSIFPSRAQLLEFVSALPQSLRSFKAENALPVAAGWYGPAVSALPVIDDALLSTVPTSFPALRRLSLRGATEISFTGLVRYIRDAQPALREVRVRFRMQFVAGQDSSYFEAELQDLIDEGLVVSVTSDYATQNLPKAEMSPWWGVEEEREWEV